MLYCSYLPDMLFICIAKPFGDQPTRSTVAGVVRDEVLHNCFFSVREVLPPPMSLAGLIDFSTNLSRTERQWGEGPSIKERAAEFF